MTFFCLAVAVNGRVLIFFFFSITAAFIVLRNRCYFSAKVSYQARGIDGGGGGEVVSTASPPFTRVQSSAVIALLSNVVM